MNEEEIDKNEIKREIFELYSKILDRFGYWCYTLNNRNGYCVKRRK